jgi:hypothetical protein
VSDLIDCTGECGRYVYINTTNQENMDDQA